MMFWKIFKLKKLPLFCELQRQTRDLFASNKVANTNALTETNQKIKIRINTINRHNTVKCFSEDKRNKKKYVHKVKAKENGNKVEVEIGEMVCHDDKE